MVSNPKRDWGVLLAFLATVQAELLHLAREEVGVKAWLDAGELDQAEASIDATRQRVEFIANRCCQFLDATRRREVNGRGPSASK